MISVVIPAFNEENVLKKSIPIIIDELKLITSQIQLILVDDGSSDQTFSEMKKISLGYKSTNTEITLVQLEENCGQQAAFRAGLKHCTFEWVVMMDCDLQDPPKLINVMLQQAYDTKSCIIHTVRSSRPFDTNFKRVSANVYYRIYRSLTRNKILSNSGDFRLLHKCVVQSINRSQSSRMYYRLDLGGLNCKSSIVQYERPARIAGESKYTIVDLLIFAIKSITYLGYPFQYIIAICGFMIGLSTFSLLLFGLFGGPFLRFFNVLSPGVFVVLTLISSVAFAASYFTLRRAQSLKKKNLQKYSEVESCERQFV